MPHCLGTYIKISNKKSRRPKSKIFDTNRERTEILPMVQNISLQKVKANYPCEQHEGIWGVEVLLHSLLISILDEGDRPTS
jgi:hypothetical protein